MADHKRIDRKLEFEGKIVKFYSDTMLLPDGNTEVWDFIEHKEIGRASCRERV